MAIIGAGATGTELAAELRYATRQLVAYGLDRIDAKKDIKLNMIEAGNRVLPAFPPHLSEAINSSPISASTCILRPGSRR